MTSVIIFEKDKKFLVPTLVNVEGIHASVEPVYVGDYYDVENLAIAVKQRLQEGNRIELSMPPKHILHKYAKVNSEKSFEENCDVWEINDEDVGFFTLIKYKKVKSWKYGGFEPDPLYKVYRESVDVDLFIFSKNVANALYNETCSKYLMS